MMAIGKAGANVEGVFEEAFAMYLSTRDLKTLVYGAETIFGILIFLLGVRCLFLFGADPLGNGISGLVLLLVGIGLIIFGVETYLLRDDPDIFR
jgi:hypothetical protein